MVDVLIDFSDFFTAATSVRDSVSLSAEECSPVEEYSPVIIDTAATKLESLIDVSKGDRKKGREDFISISSYCPFSSSFDSFKLSSSV